MGLFGADGIRGVVNEDLTPEAALRLGKAVGTYIGGSIAVAADTRSTADMVRSSVISGMMSVGCTVYDLGILPLPALQYYVKMNKAVSGGVMITAPQEARDYNGVKCILFNGIGADESAEKEIERIYEEGKFHLDPENIGGIIEIKTVAGAYVNAVLETVDVDEIKKSKLRVVVDCANGAASVTTPLLLQKMGIYTITLNANPQGEFSGREEGLLKENLSDAIALIAAAGADLGIAHDVDGDRAIFITGDGSFVSGDMGIALMARYILSEDKGKVTVPVTTSSAVEEVVKDCGGETVYTEIGSPAVIGRMKENGSVFGGEENGGMVFPEFQYCCDATVAIAKMIECITKNGPLGEQVASMPVYHMIKRDIDCPEDMKGPLLDHIKENCREGDIEEIDGVKVFFDDGWVIARPSTTEEKFRFVSESKDESIASALLEEFEKDAADFLSI